MAKTKAQKKAKRIRESQCEHIGIGYALGCWNCKRRFGYEWFQTRKFRGGQRNNFKVAWVKALLENRIPANDYD